MPNGDFTPPECPRAQYHDQTPEAFPGCPVMTTRAGETICQSQVSSIQMASADKMLQQKLIINLL